MPESWPKKGKRSKKSAPASKQVKESRKDSMYAPCEPIGGGPDAFERRYNQNYRKTALSNRGEEELGLPPFDPIVVRRRGY